ncbi:MAG: ergothioneine biosynthesis protein EgtB [Agarilytica sp.]
MDKQSSKQHLNSLIERYQSVRRQTVALTEGLSAEDLGAQSMPDASPGKWHLAHTSWFFETFILQRHQQNFQPFNEKFCYLFNSYYETVGERHARPQRGLLTRPSLENVIEYRHAIDESMLRLLAEKEDVIAPLVIIGLHHEMQHQELFLTDLLNLLSYNPLAPAVLQGKKFTANEAQALPSLKFERFDAGLITQGAAVSDSSNWEAFSYDCEQPQHQTFLQAFGLAARLTSNAEWLEFIADGGYENPLLWLSDGWAEKEKHGWRAPLYWQKNEGEWFQFGLDGLQPVNPAAPVHHVSYFEADAFARWAGKRLPKEKELEYIASEKPIAGNFLESYAWRPFSSGSSGDSFEDIYGDVWEWTQSAFSPYPGFDPKQGALGEYNGKFMNNQYVLKGGSCVTPKWQMRATYRNFFYPHQRWQFTGLRLAEDL